MVSRSEKGEITTAMLREELRASESTAARLRLCMARKAEAWKIEAEDGKPAAYAAANRADLALANTRAVDVLLETTKKRMGQAMNVMYRGLVRRSWNNWLDLTRCCQSLEAAEHVTRLIGAAALVSGVFEPLLRRRKRLWLHRWAGAMRAERVLEVQAAAVELQCAVRGFSGRARARQRRRDIAAVEVQRTIRGVAGRARGARRARFLKEVWAVELIEQRYLGFVWQRAAVWLLELKRTERAATRVQAAWRGLVWGKRPVRRLRLERVTEVSALMVQRLWRGIIAREEAEALLEEKTRREAALRIQTLARGRL